MNPVGSSQYRKHAHHQYLAVSGSSQSTQKTRFTTRHLAALDFLLNIPMKNEPQIRENGMQLSRKILSDQGKIEDGELKNEQSIDFFDEKLLAVDAVGKKLQGVNAPNIKIPLSFRYLIQRISEQSTVVRQWEEQLLLENKGTNSNMSMNNSRLFFSRARCYPTAVFSVIMYDAEKTKKSKSLGSRGLNVFELEKRDWRGLSFQQFFHPTYDDPDLECFYKLGYMYDPDSLDDPNLVHGSHRYVLQRHASTGPVIASVILYVNKTELKKSLNEQFHDRHPSLPISLTLSKIRNVKKSVVIMALQLSFEFSTAALAIINFERLCLKGLVVKENRRLSMAVSLLLAFKFLEPISHDFRKRLAVLLDYFDREWEVSRKSLFDAEFGGLMHLGFVLHVPQKHLDLIFRRILMSLNKSSRSYLGDDMNDLYLRDVIQLDKNLHDRDSDHNSKGSSKGNNENSDESDNDSDASNDKEDGVGVGAKNHRHRKKIRNSKSSSHTQCNEVHDPTKELNSRNPESDECNKTTLIDLPQGVSSTSLSSDTISVKNKSSSSNELSFHASASEGDLSTSSASTSPSTISSSSSSRSNSFLRRSSRMISQLPVRFSLQSVFQGKDDNSGNGTSPIKNSKDSDTSSVNTNDHTSISLNHGSSPIHQDSEGGVELESKKNLLSNQNRQTDFTEDSDEDVGPKADELLLELTSKDLGFINADQTVENADSTCKATITVHHHHYDDNSDDDFGVTLDDIGYEHDSIVKKNTNNDEEEKNMNQVQPQHHHHHHHHRHHHHHHHSHQIHHHHRHHDDNQPEELSDHLVRNNDEDTITSSDHSEALPDLNIDYDESGWSDRKDAKLLD